MTKALPSTTLPVGSDLNGAWAAYFAHSQRPSKVFMDAIGRLWQVRIEAVAEAWTESTRHMIAITGTQGLAGALAGWPPLLQAALQREAHVQQSNLDIWTRALRNGAALLDEEVDEALTEAPGSDVSASEHATERRVAAVIINFPDRRHLASDNGMTSARDRSRTERSGETARRRAS